MRCHCCHETVGPCNDIYARQCINPTLILTTDSGIYRPLLHHSPWRRNFFQQKFSATYKCQFPKRAGTQTNDGSKSSTKIVRIAIYDDQCITIHHLETISMISIHSLFFNILFILADSPCHIRWRLLYDHPEHDRGCCREGVPIQVLHEHYITLNRIFGV